MTATTTQAALVTQTVAVPAQALFTDVPSGGGFSNVINVTMPQFNASLGTLTVVKFALSVAYSADTNAITVDGPYAAFIGSGTYVLANTAPSDNFSGGGQSPVSSTLSITSPSSITATYTYTLVPEPTAIGAAGLAVATLLVRRRTMA